MHTRKQSTGFTLIELITVVVLMGILAALGGFLILVPITSFTDQARRAALTDTADNALQRISRELRNALPNSVRITGGTALEFLDTTAGGRYRAGADATGTEILTDCINDTFEVLDGILAGSITAGATNCMTSATDCLVVFNTGINFDAYTGNNLANITAVAGNNITCDGNVGWTGFPFPVPPSGQQRFFVVDAPVSYVCDLGAGQLLRYDNYSILAVQPTTPIDFGVAGELLAANLGSCNFSYSPGAGSRHGLVTLKIGVTDAASNESVTLMYQAHVSNVP